LHVLNRSTCYTCSYVDEVDSVDDLDKYSAPPLVCLVETHEHDGEVNVGMIAITPSTGDVIWDDFHGMYNEVYLAGY
jgi:DNA mismatch repair protein MSH3